MLELYSIAIPQWRKLKGKSIELLDITAKSGIQDYAPDKQHLWKYKNGEMSASEYSRHYKEKLDELMRRSPDTLESFLNRDESLAIACYCKAGDFCHRHLFIDYCLTLAQDNDLDVVYRGEIV